MKRLSVLFALSCAVVPLLMAVSPAQAQTLELDPMLDVAGPARKQPSRAGIWPLHGVDPDLDRTDDLEPLRGIIGEASVVALGESYHTVGDYYRLKHRVFRYLVEEMGFRVFAFENNWQAAERIDEYVQTCAGGPSQIVGFLHPVWQSTEVTDLLEWMCEWNRDHSAPADKISFVGFDIQGPWEDAPTLITFLGRIGIQGTHPWVAGIQSCDKVTTWYPFGQIPRASHDACIQALAAVDAHFQSNGEQIRLRTSEGAFAKARIARVAMEAYQHSVFTIAHDYPAGFSVRDVAMAEVFLAQRAMKFPGARTVMWAANVHTARNRLPRGEVPMGSHLARTLGRDFVTFALAAYETETNAPPFPCGLVKRNRGSVEDRLHKLGEDFLLVDFKRSSYLKRTATYWMGVDRVKARTDYDGLFYMDFAAMMNPLLWEACQ